MTTAAQPSNLAALAGRIKSAGAAPAAQTSAPTAPVKNASAQTGAAQTDPLLIHINGTPIKCANINQKAIFDHFGEFVADPAHADQMVANLQAQTKIASQTKVAAELEHRGRFMTFGQIKAAAAIELADAVLGGADVGQLRASVVKTAAMVYCHPQDIINEATELVNRVKRAQVEAASPNSLFFGDLIGSAARDGNSAWLGNVAEQDAHHRFSPETLSGVVQPTRGVRADDLGFQNTTTLPGNQNLNHGAKVDQGHG